MMNEFEYLYGFHMLSGVDRYKVEHDDSYYTDDAQVFRFILDGVTYLAQENPDDGYRSSLGVFEVTKDGVKNMFPPQGVIGAAGKRTEWDDGTNIIVFTDIVTNEVVLEIGTDNSDDYYPCCIMHWSPQNMAININKEIIHHG